MGPSNFNRDAEAAGGQAGIGTGGSNSSGGSQGSGGRAGSGGHAATGGNGGSGGNGGNGGTSAGGGTKGTGGLPGTGGTTKTGSGGSGLRDGGNGTTDGASVDGPASGAFAAVKAILASRCVNCHDPAHPVVPETTTFVAMDLTAAGAYAALVNRAAAETCGGVRVVPGNPTTSYLYHKVADATPCDGGRMPARGMLAIQPQLSSTDIETIRAWIADGAKP